MEHPNCCHQREGGLHAFHHQTVLLFSSKKSLVGIYSIGGVILVADHGQIVCDNSLSSFASKLYLSFILSFLIHSRLEISTEVCMPEIRGILF